MQAFGELGANLIGIEFLMVVAAIWFGCNNAARDMVGEWSIFQRERMVNLKLPSYVFSKFAIMVGLCVLQCLTLLTIVYVASDLKGSFLQSAAVLVLSSLVGAALGLAISARSSSTESAIALFPVVLLPVIALGGGIRAIYKIPEPARSLSYVVPSRWALESTLIGEARGIPAAISPGGCSGIRARPAAGALTPPPRSFPKRSPDPAATDARQREAIAPACAIHSCSPWPRSEPCSWGCWVRSWCS